MTHCHNLWNSTCDCVGKTWCPAIIYEQFLWLCCYDM